MGRLATHVHVLGPDNDMVVLEPDVEVPEWAVPQIRNPKAWAGGVLPAQAPPMPSPPVIPPAGGEQPEQAAPDRAEPADPVQLELPDTPVQATTTSTPDVPPRSGTGSSTADWIAYARDHGVDVTGSRAEVIAALDAAGIPTR